MLTQQAQARVMVLTALARRQVRMGEAARLLGRSVRQLRRIRRAFEAKGPRALVHGNRGRSSSRRVPEATRRRLIRLAETTYAGVNFQHFTELLAERERLQLSRPTLYRILRTAGLRSPRTRRPPRHRHRRDRMPQAGMLVQMDGSHHRWLEARGPSLVLHAALDDATGRVLGAVFRPQEDAQGYFRLLRHLTTTRGLPLAVYTDRHGIFHRDPRTPRTVAEQLTGRRASTQIGRALEELSIRWIPASSPQAKGRIERLFGAFQDRLVTALRLAGVCDGAGANALLPRFLRRYNARFAQPPAQPTSAYRSWPSGLDPETIFCFKSHRIVQNDNTVALGPVLLQLLPGPGGRSYAKAHVEVREHLDGTFTVLHRDQPLSVKRLTRSDGSYRAARRLPQPIVIRPAVRVPSTPGPDHPWRRMPVGKAKPWSRRAEGTISLSR